MKKLSIAAMKQTKNFPAQKLTRPGSGGPIELVLRAR